MSGPLDDASIDAIFDEAVEQGLADLPPAFAERLGSVAIVVEDEPTPDQLRSTGALGLYGLYQGVPRTAFAADGIAYPSKITLFRGPLVRASWDPASLRARVIETLHHEIAHHFGISDARLGELHGGHRHDER